MKSVDFSLEQVAPEPRNCPSHRTQSEQIAKRIAMKKKVLPPWPINEKVRTRPNLKEKNEQDGKRREREREGEGVKRRRNLTVCREDRASPFINSSNVQPLLSRSSIERICGGFSNRFSWRFFLRHSSHRRSRSFRRRNYTRSFTKVQPSLGSTTK